MKLIAGLGNPGKKYQYTPHNIGFAAIDTIAKENSINPSEWEEKHSGLFWSGNLFGEKTALLKPQTYMNSSGKSVAETINGLRLESDDLLVVQDELDLDWGQVRASYDSSSAGHKGVKSIIDALNTKEFWRIRVGVCPEPKPANPDRYLTHHKLKKEKERDRAKKSINKGIEKLKEKLEQES